MDDDSLNFGSPAAVATPNSNSILAQPPLEGEDATASGYEDLISHDEGTAGDGEFPIFLSLFSHELNITLLRHYYGGRRR